MGIPIADLPAHAADAGVRLLEAYRETFGDDLVAAWLDGGTTFADRPLRRGDVDICFVVGDLSPEERRPSEWCDDPTSRPSCVGAAETAIAADVGVTFDTSVYVEREMRAPGLPGDAFAAALHNTGWAVVRAHWLAGQYVHLHGALPESLVVAPTASEMANNLDREIEHLERHVHEGDSADPYEATYAIWSGCRVLSTIATGSPVISKRSAGTWGLEHLDVRWHAAIHAAGRNYDGIATDDDVVVLRETMGPFVAMVRAHVPVTSPLPPGPPRWTIDLDT